MNRKQFAASLAEEHKILKHDALRIVDMVMNHLRRQILRGSEVMVTGMGAFRIKYRKPTNLPNNVTGTRHELGPRIRLKFRVSPVLQKALNATLAKELAKDEGDIE